MADYNAVMSLPAPLRWEYRRRLEEDLAEEKRNAGAT